MNDLKKDVLIKNKNPHEDYDLMMKVGSGTYGEVYKAKCHATNQLAAIKIIKIEDQEDYESIESEIRLMKACVHPNIVAFYGSYIRRDKLWICMEFCGGGSLQDIYHATGPLPENIIAFVCREVLRGLNYLHVSRNILHRDVKITANILLSDQADVKLADFGVSAQITTTMNCKRRTFIGTPFWMAPEVAAVDRKGGYNQSCDIWSVGITAIELAELQPPLYDLHPMRALYIMSKSGFKPPTLKSKEKWSPIFHDFIKVALTKSPKKRPNAERLLTHQFVRCTIDRRLIINLIEKSRNPPNRYNLVLNELDPEDELELDLPSRITSKKSFKSKPESPDNRKQQYQNNQQQYQPLRSQICKIVDSDSVNNQNFEKNLINNKLINRPSSSNSNNNNLDSLESWMNSQQQKDQYQKSLLEIVDEELLQRGHKSLTTLDKEFKSTLTKTTIGQFASYINEPLAGCNRLSDNSISFGQRDILNNSSTNYQMIDHNLSNSNMIKEQVEYNQPIDYHLLTKPQMQFDFLKEKYLIDTDLTNTSETNTPNDYEFKNFLFNKNNDDDDDDDKTIEETIASEHFEDYQSDNLYQFDNIIEFNDDSDDDHNKFEEANDNLIDLYASAISGLLIDNNDSNKNKNRLDLKRREIQNKVNKFKNRFSQQLDYSSIVCKNENSLEFSKSKDDYFINSNLNEQKKWYELDNGNKKLNNNNLKDNLDKLNKQITLLDEQKYITTTNNNLITNTNYTNNNTNQLNYEDKLAELSDWSIDTIETLINELCKEEKLNDQPSGKSSNDRQFNTSSNDNDGELEFSTPPSTPKSSNSSPNDSLNKSNNQSASYHYSTAKQNLTKQDLLLSQKYDQSNLVNNNQPPSAPPRTRRKQGSLLASKSDSSSSSFSSNNKSNDNSKQHQQRSLTNGLPPTPKVHMGACFSKVFNKCPLKINCCVNWVNTVTRDEHLLFGCDEGIYTLNMNELHDACLDQLFPRMTTWMFVIGNTLMSISGKMNRHLYCHDVLQLHNRILQNKDHNTKLSQTMDQVINRIPEKFTPWRVSCTTKISSISKGVKHCCVVHNKSNGYKYLAGATESSVFLMQWYNPLNKFMLLKQYDLQLPSQIRVFEMIISPDVEYPLLCIGAKRCRQPNKIQLDLINLNSSSSWFSNEFGDGQETVIPKNQVLNLICVRQIDKDAILVCYENIVRIVNLKGELKNSKKYVSEIIFEFNIDSLVYLTDSVLAFHKHGMVGKSLKNCEITQEITDRSGFYRVLNMESKTITLESKVPDDVCGPSNLYVVSGHTDSESSF